jgi:PleD family two-component response regulator
MRNLEKYRQKGARLDHMKILAVDTDAAELAVLTESLQKVYKDASIKSFGDPLMAVKYGANNPVDAVYTAAAMRRLSGFELVKLLRGFNPDIMSNFIADTEAERTDAMRLMAESCILRPVTADAIRHAAEEEW